MREDELDVASIHDIRGGACDYSSTGEGLQGRGGAPLWAGLGEVGGRRVSCSSAISVAIWGAQEGGAEVMTDGDDVQHGAELAGAESTLERAQWLAWEHSPGGQPGRRISHISTGT